MPRPDLDSSDDDFYFRPHRFSCERRTIPAPALRRKLQELQSAGVDIDRLPNDLKLFVVMQLTPEAAQRIIDAARE